MNDTPLCGIRCCRGAKIMNEQAVYFNDSPVGTVQIKKEGLYYQFSSQCRLKERKMYRLILSCGESTRDLGILVPEGDVFTHRKRLPVKTFPAADFHFSLQCEDGGKAEKRLVVKEDEPFAGISMLENAVLSSHDGEMTVVIRDPE